MSSGESGVTLGRLIAAERNASAALEGVKEQRQITPLLAKQLQAAEAEILQLKQIVAALQAQIHSGRGTGPTA